MNASKSQSKTASQFMKLSIDMFCTLGTDGFFKSLNPNWERVLGYKLEELMAKPRVEFIHPDDRETTETEVRRIREDGVLRSFENRYLCKDGTCRWFLWNAVYAPEENLIYGVARDITARKQAEAIVRESEERYHKLFDLNPQPTWVYDRETLRFLAVNDAAIANYGYSRSEFLSLTIRDIRPSEDAPALLKAVADVENGQRDVSTWRHC